MMFKKKIFYGWWIVLATNIICMLGFGTWLYSFGVFFKPMMDEFGWTRAMTAGAASLRSTQGGIAGPIVGWAVDKWGSRKVIIFGGIISGSGFALMALVNSLLMFYLIYGLLLSIGMSFMLYLPAFTVIAKWFRRGLSRAMAVLAVGAGLGGLIFAPLSAFLIKFAGWRIAFLLIGILVWIVVIPLALLIKEKPEDIGLRPDGVSSDKEPAQKNDPEKPSNPIKTIEASFHDFTLKQALASSTFWLLAGAFFCQSLAHSVVFVHGVPHLTDLGISVEKAAFSIGLLTLVSVAGRLIFGYLGDFFDKRFLFSISYALMGTGIFVLLYAKTMPMVYLFILIFGVGFGGNVPLMPAMQAEYFGRTAMGKIQGSMTPLIMFAGTVGPIMAGYFFDKQGSYFISFLIISIAPFVAAIMVFFIPSLKKHRQER
ncbi:MAG: hypothetical protein A2Y79_03915 [Deltaproteobacteria bacterium RBG_13_43_22]|nr:MAG: hypothetical protein A2Y79_03915 [Deltaproteobacteria bacterium RBG_13_43_22]